MAAVYTGRQSVFDAYLGEFKDLGFSLREIDDHLAELYFKDLKVHTYNQHTLTSSILEEGCRNYLKNM